MKRKKRKYTKTITIIVIIISNALIYYLTYKTGGIRSIYSQLMYLPVIFSGAFLGLKAGMMNAMFSGLLLGPIMPIDLTLSNPDELWFWLVRLAFLLIVGILTGYLSDKTKENRKILRSYEIITRKNLSRK
ncbi:MAG: hypothetical protein RBR96_05040 [Candidatus Izemoplasmatales bacterium]|nr:hypothetical protein [Candidatus Izemoplasmatales bacterium]